MNNKLKKFISKAFIPYLIVAAISISPVQAIAATTEQPNNAYSAGPVKILPPDDLDELERAESLIKAINSTIITVDNVEALAMDAQTARRLYNDLSISAKVNFSAGDLKAFIAIEKAIPGWLVKATDKASAGNVVEEIRGITIKDTITRDDREGYIREVELAKAHYDALTVAGKKLVDKDSVTKLTKEVAKIKAYTKGNHVDADDVNTEIGLLNSTFTKDNEVAVYIKVHGIREQYNLLTVAEQAYVTNYSKLAKLEIALEDFFISTKVTNQIEQLRQYAVGTVEEIHAAITVENVYEIRAHAEWVNRNFNALTAKAKKLVSNQKILTDTLVNIKDPLAAAKVLEEMARYLPPSELIDNPYFIASSELIEVVKMIRADFTKLTPYAKKLVNIGTSRFGRPLSEQTLIDWETAIAKNINPYVKNVITAIEIVKENATSKGAIEVSLENVYEINEAAKEARGAFNELTKAQQKLVTNSKDLKTIEIAIVDPLAAKIVIDEISELPEASYITVDTVGSIESAVTTARAHFKKLTAKQKAFGVSEEALIAVEKAITDVNKLQAEPVINEITSISDMVINSDKDAMEVQKLAGIARLNYEKLTVGQQSLVTNIKKLVDVEVRIKNVGLATDKEAAKKVITEIDKIATASSITMKVTDEQRQAIQAASNSYNELTASAKLMVTNIKILTDSVKAINDVDAAQSVYDEIEALPSISDLSLEDEGITVPVRIAFNKLTKAQQALLSAQNKKMQDTEIAIKNKITFAVNTVKAEIAALPAKSKITSNMSRDDMDALFMALNLVMHDYTSLTEDQRKSVGSISKIIDAINALQDIGPS